MAADIGYGAKVTLNSEDFTAVTEIQVPAEEEEQLDGTHLNSPDRRRQFVPGLINPGTWQFTSIDPADYERLFDVLHQTVTYTVTFTDDSTAAGEARVTKIERTESNDLIKSTCHLQNRGKVTYT